MDEPIIVSDESATQAATEAIAQTVAEELAPVVAAAVAEAADEDDTLWVRELLDEKLRENRESLLTLLTEMWSPYRTILDNLSRIVETQSAALALATSSQVSQTPASTATPQESEPVAEPPIPTTEPASVEAAPVEVRTESSRRKLRKI